VAGLPAARQKFHERCTASGSLSPKVATLPTAAERYFEILSPRFLTAAPSGVSDEGVVGAVGRLGSLIDNSVSDLLGAAVPRHRALCGGQPRLKVSLASLVRG
jgi:hypothetical protein